MTLSILHRATGVALSVGLIVFTVWLVALSTGAQSYAQVAGWLQTLVGRVLLIGFSAAFFYHLCNGVRHLFWDVGMGFEMRQANASAWFVVVATIVLTVAFWLVV